MQHRLEIRRGLTRGTELRIEGGAFRVPGAAAAILVRILYRVVVRVPGPAGRDSRAWKFGRNRRRIPAFLRYEVRVAGVDRASLSWRVWNRQVPRAVTARAAS